MDAAALVLCIGVTGGLIALAVALAAASALGLALRRRAGRFRRRAGPGQGGRADRGRSCCPPSAWKATLVQFSTAFCAPCRPTRQILAQVAGMVDGVTHIDAHAAARLDLARRLRVNSTPTVLVLDPDGAIVKRAVGLLRKADVIAALGSVIEPAAPGIAAPASGSGRAGSDRATRLYSTRLAGNNGNNSGPGSDSPTEPA